MVVKNLKWFGVLCVTALAVLLPVGELSAHDGCGHAKDTAKAGSCTRAEVATSSGCGSAKAIATSGGDTCGKAAVAKIKPYELITQVNGTPVKSTAEFKTATAEAGVYQLAIRRMHNRRLVKLEITAAAPPTQPAGGE